MQDILLKDRAGEDIAYSGVSSVLFDTAGGGTARFSRGTAVAGEAAADFSGGDQVITPGAEELFSSLRLLKPETLVPENIVKDVNIAGIWGNYIGGHNIVSAQGIFTATGTVPQTVTMNLDTVPDILLVFSRNSTSGYLNFCFGVSSKMAEKISHSAQYALSYGNYPTPVGYVYGIDQEDPYGYGFIQKAGPGSFTLGGSGFKLYAGASYEWKAIGGILAHDFFYLKTALRDYHTLVITGGVPQISQLEIYMDGALAKTVDYVHGEEFAVDLSDVADDYLPHTYTVKALGEDLDTLYPKQYYGSVSNDILAGGTCGEDVKWRLTKHYDMTILGTGPMSNYTAQTEQPWYSYAGSIKTLTVSDGVTAVGDWAFYQLTALTTLTLSGSVQKVGQRAFWECTSLNSVHFSEGLTTLGYAAFYKCTALASLTLPKSLTVLEGFALANCSILTNLVLPENLTYIGRVAFQSLPKLYSITIPASVRMIGEKAFNNNAQLAAVTFEDPAGWKYCSSETATSGTAISAASLANASTAATYLKTTYLTYWWRKD